MSRCVYEYTVCNVQIPNSSLSLTTLVYTPADTDINIYCPLLGGCYVYSSKINTLRSER